MGNSNKTSGLRGLNGFCCGDIKGKGVNYFIYSVSSSLFVYSDPSVWSYFVSYSS